MRKRLVALLVGGAIAAGSTIGLAACTGKDSNKITLWGPSAQQESLQQMVNLFLEQNPDFGLKIELGIAGESDAFSMMSNDPKSGADVFAYANDQVVNLYSLGALARIGEGVVEGLKEANVEASVEAGKVGEGYYGYPYAADNGFFMYYDSSVVSEEQAKTLDGVLKACADAKKYFIYQLTTGWYVGSFTYGAGGEYTVTYEGTAVTDITCNFDEKAEGSDYTYGEIGGQMLIDLKANKYKSFVDGDDKTIASYLSGGRFGACISGTWNAGLIKSYLQTKDADGNVTVDHYAATVLPTWESPLTHETYDWKSFAGYKLYGVNSYSKHLAKAHQLAQFLSSEAMQEKRFDDNEIGPANKNVAAMEKVTSNVAIGAISRQIATNSVIQTPMPQSYWTEMESFGNAMKDWSTRTGDEAKQTLLERVQELVTALKAN